MSTVVNRIIKYKRNLSAEERMRSVQNVLYPKFISSLNIMLYLHPLLDIMSKNTFYSLTPLGWSQGLCKAAVHVVVFTQSPKVGRGHCQLSIVAALICIMNHHHYWHYWGHRYFTILLLILMIIIITSSDPESQCRPVSAEKLAPTA